MDFNETDETSSPLSAAIKAGDNEAFERLLSENYSVDVADSLGWRPLHFAASIGNLAAITRLILHDGNVIDWTTFEGETALFLATLKQHYNICVCLLENGAQANISTNDDKVSPLHMAARNGDLRCVQLLLKHGAKVDANDCYERVPLHNAALVGHADVISLLLDHGADTLIRDDEGRTPLFMAAETGVLSCLSLLCDRMKGSKRSHDTFRGTTPVMVTAEEGRADCLRYLLGNGWGVDYPAEDGVLALHLAAQGGHLDCVKELFPRTGKAALLKACYGKVAAHFTTVLPGLVYLATGNNEQIIKKAGLSFLHIAVRYNMCEMLEYFLENGADPNLYVVHRTIDWGKYVRLEGNFMTALGLACYGLNKKAVEILLKHGANIKMCEGNVLNPLYCALKSGCDLHFARSLIDQGAEVNSHAEFYEDSPTLYITFKDPKMFAEMLEQGAQIYNYEHIYRDLDTINIISAIWTCRDHLTEYGILELLTILANFLPRIGCITQSCRKMFSKMHPEQSLNEEGEHFDEWRSLFKLLDCVESLRQLCRRKVRGTIKSAGRNLQMKVTTLQLPQSLKDYLMFR